MLDATVSYEQLSCDDYDTGSFVAVAHASWYKTEGVTVKEEIGRIFAPCPSNGLGSLRVHPQWQGRGIGKKLMILYADHLRSSGESILKLRCSKTNFHALAFYRHLGFALSDCESSESLYDVTLSLV